MSTIVISLLVVGGAVAVVLWITAGEMAQPATQDDTPTGRGPDGDETTTDETEATDVDEPHEPAPPEAPPAVVTAALPGPARDATGPVEGTVPQAVPSRPAGTAAAPGTRRRKAVSLPGSYSFDSPPPITWARRLRSVLGVVLVVSAVGLALAASVGVLVVFVSRALEGAVN